MAGQAREGMEAVELLRKVPLFAGLEGEQIQALAARSRWRSFPRKASLLHAGEPGACLYVLLSGRVQIQAVTPAGQAIHLANRGPGDTIGELALLDGQPRMADAVTLEPTEALMLPREEFQRCLAESNALARAVIACLAGRLREAADLYASQQTQDVLGRVSALLLELAETQGRPAAAGQRIPGLSQRRIAEQIGATRETVNRAFARLKQVNAIQVEGRDVTVTDERKLRLYAGA